MDPLIPVLLTFVGTLVTSGGLWAYLDKRSTRKSAQTKLLLGLAHREIIFVGLSFVDKGWVSKDEYEDFIKYLYEPYSTFGGNGLAEKVMQEVVKLPIRNDQTSFTITKEKPHVQ